MKLRKISGKSASNLAKAFSAKNILTALVLIIVGVVIGFVFQNTFMPLQQRPVNAEKVDGAIVDYITLYYGLINVTILDKSFEDGVWTVDISAISHYYPTQLRIELYDSNLSVFSIVQRVPLRDKPVTVAEIPGKISCSSGGRTAIDIYIDPYDDWSRTYDNLIETFTARFGNSISPIWRIVRTRSMALSKQDPNTILALSYLECVKDSPLFMAIRKCIYAKYEAKGAVLTETELVECLQGTGTDVEAVQNCAESEGLKELGVDESFGATYLGEITTPMIVIDCRYRTWPTFIDRVMCHLYPELDECKKE